MAYFILKCNKEQEGNKVYFNSNPMFKPYMAPLLGLKPIRIGNLELKLEFFWRVIAFSWAVQGKTYDGALYFGSTLIKN